MLVPIDKKTGKKKTKLTAAEKAEFDAGKARATAKPRPRSRPNKHPGLRNPKPVAKAKEKSSGTRSSR